MQHLERGDNIPTNVKIPSRSRVIRFIADHEGITLEEVSKSLFNQNEELCCQLLDEVKKQRFIDVEWEILNPDTFTLVYTPGRDFELPRYSYHYRVTALGLEYLREHRFEQLRDWTSFFRSLLPF